MARGLVRDREDVLNALKEQGLRINREGRDYISVIAPGSGMKMRFRGGFYAKSWTPKAALEEEPEEKKDETARRRVARLQQDFERVIEKRAACNTKRYPAKWTQLPREEALLLPRLQKDTIHDRNRTDVDAKSETDGGKLQRPADAFSTRLNAQEEKQMLIQSELRTLKRLFTDVSEVYSSLQTLLATLKNGA